MAKTSGQESQQYSTAPAPDAWGQPISPERQTELQGYLDRWSTETDHGERKGPLDGTGRGWERGMWLTGADAFWLAEQSGRGEFGQVPNLHLEGAILFDAHLEGASLRFAHLEGAFLSDAHLEGAGLPGAHLEGTQLQRAHLEGVSLIEAHLQGASLKGAHLDENTSLNGAILGPGFFGRWLDRFRFRNRYAALGDIKWHEADLTGVLWERVTRLGDERATSLFGDADFGDVIRPDAHRDVVRAYRQVAAQLRDQGMAEAADHFAYRAQIRQRGVLLRTFRLPQYLFSWVLAILAGYGYRPGRTLFWYLVTIASFAFMYLQATHGWVPFGLPQPSAFAPLPWYEALILSVSSFHGRGFFQPVQSLGDPIAALAAIEAVIGLFIEISFIATFTQRYFGNR